MVHRRRLGVEEGNAIETIVAYEMRLKRGVATAADKLAHDKACRFMGIHTPIPSKVRPVFDEEVDDEREDMPPPVSYMFSGPFSPQALGLGLMITGAWVLLALIGLAMLVLVSNVAHSLISLAHP